MKAHSFLDYNVDIKKQDARLAEFKALPLKQQREHLVDLLDKNMLYVPLSALNDTAYGITEEDRRITQDFYGLNK